MKDAGYALTLDQLITACKAESQLGRKPSFPQLVRYRDQGFDAND